jgi:sugar phosphate isomerase/epimerase
MKIGFYTSTFDDRPIEEVLDFASSVGFDAVEIDINRHVKSPENLVSVLNEARERDLAVAAVTLLGNQLDPDPGKRRALHERTRDFAHALAESGGPALVLFPGRDPATSEDANYKSFSEYARGLLAQETRLEVAIENWPGPNNDFIAVSPEGWRRLLDLVPEPRFGVEFDPSHLIRIGVDPFRAYDGVKDRVKIIHAKDTSIDASRLQEAGWHGSGWWRYRLPGRGLLDWRKFVAHAHASGFEGIISVEHEDADFGWPLKDLALRKQGEVEALRLLRVALSGA